MMKPIIGLQLSSLTEYLDTEEHIKATLAKVTAIGYTAVQLQGVPAEISNAFLAAELKRNGLDCVATQEDYPFGFGEHPQTAIERAAACGSRYLAFALIPKEVDSTDKLNAFAQKLMPVCEMVREAGLRFSFHPIGSDYRDMDGKPVFERLLDLLPDEVHLTFCLNAAFGSKTDISDVFARYDGRMELVHFKDHIVLPDGRKQLTPLGEGSHSWKPYYDMCCEHSVRYIFTEQERHTRDAFDSVKASLNYLESII